MCRFGTLELRLVFIPCLINYSITNGEEDKYNDEVTNLIISNCSTHSKSGVMLFGGKYPTKFNYYYNGPLITITLLGFEIYDYTSALTSPFLLENENYIDFNNPIGIISPGLCYTTQEPILLMVYYYANKHFYLHLLPNQNCNRFHVFSLTINFVIHKNNFDYIKNKTNI
ncbi:hypothetical protein ACTA71_010448 [Dictyostelium dimigraforme]